MDRERKIAEVELSRRTLDEAVSDGLRELGLQSRDQAEITVVSEGKPGFFGIGREMAVVVMRPKPAPAKKRRRRRKGGRTDDTGEKDQSASQRSSDGKRERARPAAEDDRNRGRQQKAGAGQGRGGRPRTDRRSAASSGPQETRDKGNGRSQKRNRPAEEPSMTKNQKSGDRQEESSIEEQAEIAVDFVKGLLDAFGLEGAVTTEIDADENILKIDVSGDQTEALVGRKGSIMQSVLELTRTVVQRKTYGAPRMRMDINGYGERRREALRIYAARLAEQVVGDGNEVMLEPMNAADRKVVHDAIAEIEGVESFSEGQDPERAVVIAPAAKSED